jgi:glycosyltransferase involved in cell wall biosynthesis
MNIAVDARELAGRRPTGVGTFLAALLAEWVRMPDARAHRWTLYYAAGARFTPAPGGPGGSVRPGPVAGPTSPGAARVNGEAAGGVEWHELPGNGGTMWEQGTLAAAIRRARPDVLFAPGYTAPLAIRTPVVLVVHDLSFFARPGWFSMREGVRRRAVTRWAARRARVVVTISEFSKREIVARLGIPADRVIVVRPGISHPVSLPAPDSRPPIVLYVGSIFNRRHVPDLVRAFALLAADVPDARLEIVGDNRTHPFEDVAALARDLGVLHRVNLRSYVSGTELDALYANARAFAFLSEYEGFGLTPLEALAHLVPVVVLDTPVAREVYDDAAVYVGTGDVAATAAALKRLLLDPGARDAQLRAAERVVARSCWPDAARRMLDVILQAGARG